MPWTRPEGAASASGLGNRHPHQGRPDTARRTCLDCGGFLTCVFHEGGTLKLQVTNRAVPSCRETITVTADDNGAWSFRWSWDDRIALVDEVAAAAFKIAYVLTPQAG